MCCKHYLSEACMYHLTVLLPAEIYKLSSDTLLPSNLITGRSDNSGRVVPSIITESVIWGNGYSGQMVKALVLVL